VINKQLVKESSRSQAGGTFNQLQQEAAMCVLAMNDYK